MSRTIWIALFVLLSGCATQPEWRWEKPGASGQQYSMDNGQCRAQAFSVASGNMMQIALVYDGCMQGKGWYRVAAK